MTTKGRVVSIRAISGAAAAMVLLLAAFTGRAQHNLSLPPLPQDQAPRPKPQPKILEQLPDEPGRQPSHTVSLSSIGFSVPGVAHILHHESLVSLDFLGEDRLLLTFRVSGLMTRDIANDSQDDQRQIRALVIDLPAGKIESEAHWIVSDRTRYLWSLWNGTFLLRDQDGLEQGDASLKLKPLDSDPGKLLWVALNPAQDILITNTLQAADKSQPANRTDHPAEPAADEDQSQQLVVRTVQWPSGEMLKTLRVPWSQQTTDWPFNSDGYVEKSNTGGMHWQLSLTPFADGDKKEFGRVDSACAPTYDFVAADELWVNTCDTFGGRQMVALSSRHGKLWQMNVPVNEMTPVLALSQDGSVVARESLLLEHELKHYKRGLAFGDVTGQVLHVIDTRTGKSELDVPIKPVLDGGGNVAISPSGHQIAVLNSGSIQIFDLSSQDSSAVEDHPASTH